MEAVQHIKALKGHVFLVTGADGMLGRAFVRALSELGSTVTVHALSRGELDVTDPKAVSDCTRFQPQTIIHCAAMTDADLCEQVPEITRTVQVGGTRNIGSLAREVGATVFYPQSVLIFDGRELPFTEKTQPAPGSVYAETKLEAEQYLLSSVHDTLSVRMAGFFGGDEKDKNFVGKFLRELETLVRRGQREIEVGD
ncbi:MAG: sugar nucleotide-binding protein, partial [Rhodothermales bacterium]|nr:sugar nucleotide-binding protein [Rhodothermales bacterium]